MAIAYVGGATNSTGAGTATTLTITYTSTTTNALYLAILAFNGTTNITSVTDSASNAWTLSGGLSTASAAINCGSLFLAQTTSNSPTGVTTVTIHATTATNICAVLGEYSGVTTTQNNGTGTAAQATTIITGSSTTFLASMVGGTILYASGQSAPITGFTSTTQIASTTSQTVTPTQAFVIFFNGGVSAASPVTSGAQTVVSGNWLPSAMCCQTLNALPVFTTGTGTLRNQATMTLPAGYGFAGVALVDNTTGTSVTDTANFSGTYLTSLALSQKAT
jgi:hypothetical protein